MADYIDTGVRVTPDMFELGDGYKGPDVKVRKITAATIADISPDPAKALRIIENMVSAGVIIHIEDLGTIDETPAGKQLLNTLASMLE